MLEHHPDVPSDRKLKLANAFLKDLGRELGLKRVPQIELGLLQKIQYDDERFMPPPPSTNGHSTNGDGHEARLPTIIPREITYAPEELFAALEFLKVCGTTEKAHKAIDVATELSNRVGQRSAC